VPHTRDSSLIKLLRGTAALKLFRRQLCMGKVNRDPTARSLLLSGFAYVIALYFISLIKKRRIKSSKVPY
jgi:hypothetical protein